LTDEPPARAQLLRFLAPLPEFQWSRKPIRERRGGDHRPPPDIVYLDIQLGDPAAYEVIEAIRGQIRRTSCSRPLIPNTPVGLRRAGARLPAPSLRPRTIFAQRRARKVELADPDQVILRNAAARARQPAGQPAPIKQIRVRDRAAPIFIAVDDIDRLMAAGITSRFHVGEKVHLMREPLWQN